MLKKILDKDLPKKEVRELFREAIDQAQLYPLKIVNEINQLSQELQPIFIKHFDLSLALILTSISINQCFDFLDDKLDSEFLKIISILAHEKIPEKSSKLSQLFQRFTTLEKCLVVFKIFSLTPSQSIKEAQIPQFIPTFIRMAAHIIDQFLTLKNQPTKGSEDRIQDDKVIVNNCEKWVSVGISNFFKRLPQIHNEQIKNTVLLAICDLTGALLQILREKTMDQKIVNVLLEKEIFKYFSRNYPLAKAHTIFTSRLRKEKYQNPIKKLQIPQVYIHEAIPNTQAMAFFTLKCLQTSVYSRQSQIQFIVPILCEMLSRPYEIKTQLMSRLKKLLSEVGKHQTSTGYEWNYPIGLSLFYLSHYQHQEYLKIKQFIKFKSQQVQLNALIQLKLINIPNFSSQRDQFIFERIVEKKYSNIRLLTLLKNSKFEGVNYKAHNLLIGAIKEAKNSFPAETREIIEERLRQTRDNQKVHEELKQIK